MKTKSTHINLLIVDDELDLLDIYREMFEESGFNVRTACCMSEALEVLAEGHDMDIIVSDYIMENGSGLDLLTEVNRKEKEFKGPKPVFYICTGSHSLNEYDVTSLGAKRLLKKPFDVDEMVNKIKTDFLNYSA